MRKQSLAWAFILLAAAAVPAAAQKKSKKAANADTTQGDGAAATPAAAPKPATDDPNYVIGSQDVLDINVWKEPDITRTVPVRPDGKISLPLINDVQATGLTPQQLANEISSGLTKFITNPQVTVIVSQMNSQRIYVMGQVARVGAYQLIPGMNVLQAISNAGGFNAFANVKKIYVIRQQGGHEEHLPFNYKEVIAGKQIDQNIVLQPGDTIFIP